MAKKTPNPGKSGKPFWEKVPKKTAKKPKPEWEPAPEEEKKKKRPPVHKKRLPEAPDPDKPVRLNRFIGQAGVCSRREADALIARGEIKVNGKVVKELGTKILPGQDRV
ncbi:MAG: ribosomal large subunit pseudouridine synthase B, partial [Bacteroidetes bacterium]